MMKRKRFMSDSDIGWRAGGVSPLFENQQQGADAPGRPGPTLFDSAIRAILDDMIAKPPRDFRKLLSLGILLLSAVTIRGDEAKPSASEAVRQLQLQYRAERDAAEESGAL